MTGVAAFRNDARMGPRLSSQQQTCKACLQPDPFNFHVPDATWVAVVPRRLRNRVVCLPCFDAFATRRRVDYLSAMSAFLYFAGRRTALRFRLERERPNRRTDSGARAITSG